MVCRMRYEARDWTHARMPWQDVARRCAGKAGSTVTLGLLRGPYRGEIEITITRRLIGRIPLTGPNACPMVESSATAGGAARTRALDSPSETERLREHQPPGLVQSEASADLVAGGVQAGSRPQGRGGEESYEDTALGGVVGKEEDRFAGGEAGEGGEADLGARGGGILMQALQRDPWADPPRDKDAQLVYPERWGSGDYSGWGRGGDGSIACNVVSGTASGEEGAPGHRQDGDVVPAQGPVNPRSAGYGKGASQDSRDTGDRWRQGHEHAQNTGGMSGAMSGVLGPTTQPTNFSTAFPPDPVSPTNHLSHVTEMTAGGAGGASAGGASAPGDEHARAWSQGVGAEGKDAPVHLESQDPLVQLDSLARELTSTGDRGGERDVDMEREQESTRGKDGGTGLEGTSCNTSCHTSGPSSAGATPATSG